MRPQESRVLRREQRHAWRGMSAGRHARTVRTTYGRGQKLQERTAAFSVLCAQIRERRHADDEAARRAS